MKRNSHSMKIRHLRGVSLLETILALSVGSVVMAGSIYGINEYSNGVKVQSTAIMLKQLNSAAQQYGQRNYQDLLADAPEEIDISVLEPFYGANIVQDAFRSTYRISTRTYPVTVPDYENGGTKTIDALQMLILGEKDTDSQLDDDIYLRAEVANTAGAMGAFVSEGSATCETPAGVARPDGYVCGAFGSYSFEPANFPASTIDDFAYGTLVTLGDQSVYGDQLYRYDMGDPDLNTMHTDVQMGDNNIVDPDEIQSVNTVSMGDGDGALRAAGASITLESRSTLSLRPGDGRVLIQDNNPADGNDPRVASDSNALHIGDSGDEAVFGDEAQFVHGSSTRNIGDGTVKAGSVETRNLRADEINTLTGDLDDPLRLVNRPNGMAIVGSRIRYQPDGSATYEISDGRLVAGELRARDIVCADCGGSLSEILPKWRHMGTYYVWDNVTRPSGTRVPKPSCVANRRGNINRAAVPGTQGEANWDEGGGNNDMSYVARIVLVPKNMRFNVGAADGRVGNATTGTTTITFKAFDRSTYWIAKPEVRVMKTSESEGGIADALAMTYCVYTGGVADPADTDLPPLNGAGDFGGAWTRLD